MRKFTYNILGFTSCNGRAIHTRRDGYKKHHAIQLPHSRRVWRLSNPSPDGYDDYQTRREINFAADQPLLAYSKEHLRSVGLHYIADPSVCQMVMLRYLGDAWSKTYEAVKDDVVAMLG
jgi:hypothetical protein